MDDKHKSKLYKGFLKQYKRQQSKLREVKIKLPIAVDLPKNFKGKYKHCLTVNNSIWNGMNLVQLMNSFNVCRVGGINGVFQISTDGKYKLSYHGKKVLRRKKEKQTA